MRKSQHSVSWSDDPPAAIPYMVCPACEEYWCLVNHMCEWWEEVPRSQSVQHVYSLMTSCKCGASWSTEYVSEV